MGHRVLNTASPPPPPPLPRQKHSVRSRVPSWSPGVPRGCGQWARREEGWLPHGLRPGELLQLLRCSAVTSSLREPQKLPREVPETTESG